MTRYRPALICPAIDEMLAEAEIALLEALFAHDPVDLGLEAESRRDPWNADVLAAQIGLGQPKPGPSTGS